jgi:hypothetical protein
MVVVLVLALFQIQSAALAGEMDTRIAALSINSTYQDLEHLDRLGCSAIPALVGDLQVVTDTELTADDQTKKVKATHAAWVVAALRYITGTDFYGQASGAELSRYSEKARYFLKQFAPSHHVKIFGSWMSRGTLYFAPERAQRQIIRKWKDYSASGACVPSTWPGRKRSEFWFFGDGQR